MSVDSKIDEDIDDVDIEDLCSSLRKSSMEVVNLYNDTFVQMRAFKKKLKEQESATYSLNTVALKAKPHTKLWLKKNKLYREISFQEFFAFVCEELAKENRLDLSKRTVKPSEDIALLFGVPAEQPIHILDFIERTPELFY
jgi:hypothetical protein